MSRFTSCVRTGAAVYGALLVTLVVGQSCEIDMCFAIDESGSLGQTRYDMELKFVTDVVDAVNENSYDPTFTTQVANPPRYSAYIFDEDSGASDKVSSLTTSHQTFKNKVTSLSATYDGGYTNIYDGIARCYETLTDKSRSRVLVLLTDGIPNRGPGSPDPTAIKENILTISEEAKNAGISLFTVGLYATSTAYLDLDLLERMSSGPGYSLFVSFGESGNVVSKLAGDYCAAPTPTATPTPTPIVNPSPSAQPANPSTTATTTTASSPSPTPAPSPSPASPSASQNGCDCDKVSNTNPGLCLDHIGGNNCITRSCRGDGYVCLLGGHFKCVWKSTPSWQCQGPLANDMCPCEEVTKDVVVVA